MYDLDCDGKISKIEARHACLAEEQAKCPTLLGLLDREDTACAAGIIVAGMAGSFAIDSFNRGQPVGVYSSERSLWRPAWRRNLLLSRKNMRTSIFSWPRLPNKGVAIAFGLVALVELATFLLSDHDVVHLLFGFTAFEASVGSILPSEFWVWPDQKHRSFANFFVALVLFMGASLAALSLVTSDLSYFVAWWLISLIANALFLILRSGSLINRGDPRTP